MDKENLKEEIKGISRDIREDLIQEAKKRNKYYKKNNDGFYYIPEVIT